MRKMTLDEMLQKGRHEAARKKPDDEEHRIQVACVRWFRLQYPKLKHILFAIPNGGRRDAVTGAKLKDEGATAGVSDLILLRSNRFYGALCIEMKKPGGRQSPTQKEWQKEVEAMGNKYVICHSLEEFMKIVKEYFTNI